MHEEADMSTIGDEISNQIEAGRKTIVRSLDDMKEIDVRDVPPAVYVAAGMVGVLAIGVVGWMFYRSRRRRTLVERFQEAIPDKVRELPDRVRRVRSS
jgi:hypothetical protein